ncbi:MULTISPECIES: site-specific integrase [unclassified Oleiphilus]|uniref:tyrosine-type recombinase/integrase n=1 Tax=unclassified Oleiphilus TaxID=2631174 RepID=UPI000A5CE12D|nr:MULTISPECIES: site-specific integrase [unclassified Oleiphilus]
MSSIGVRKNGYLHFDFRFEGNRCREYTRLKDTVANRKKMQAVLAKIDAEITLGSFDYQAYFPASKKAQGQSETLVKNSTPLFRDFCEAWFNENDVRWKQSYTKIIRGTIDNYLVPEFGSLNVNAVERHLILKFRADLARKSTDEKRSLSNDRINHIMTPLRMILEEAAARYEFPNPFFKIKPLKVEQSQVDPFSLEEVQTIVSNVRPDYRNYYIVRFFSGLRTAEIDGLRWDRVDFQRKAISVSETIVQGRKETPKTQSSYRDISMSGPVLDALKAQKENTYKDSEYVFCTRNGGPLNHRNVTQRVWYPLLKTLGIKKRRPYQSRHTAATLWLASGENPEWIARQMGHSNTKMLFSVYSRFVPNLTRQDGSAMDSLLSSRFDGQFIPNMEEGEK